MALTAYRPERPEVIRDTDVEKGFIAAFARHGTAANILMMLMIAAGVWAFFNLRTQFFPDFVQERITVNVSWPDAPAASVDEAIVQVLEPEVRFLENVDSVFASANDNSAVFSLLFKTGTDMEQALADVTSAVDAVENSFPEDAADPRIRVSAFRDPVSSILIAGPLSQSGLKTIAERMRDDLLNRGLLEVNVQGARNPEIEVEVDEAALRRLGLTPVDVSAAIARRANDLPAGTLGGERAVRTLGTEASARSIADSPIRAEPDGTETGDLRAGYARNCILARRLIERGVRFVQLFNGSYQTGGEGISNWDGHKDLYNQYRVHGAVMDQPTAGLLVDLQQRGLLEETLVVWCTEFGRMPTFQKGANGRDHNPEGFTCWLAGAGVKRGHSHGATDAFGHRAVEDVVTVHDFHATILHLLGLDHERLTYYHDGLERRLTDVAGRVVQGVLA